MFLLLPQVDPYFGKALNLRLHHIYIYIYIYIIKAAQLGSSHKGAPKLIFGWYKVGVCTLKKIVQGWWCKVQHGYCKTKL
jgi:hypothetical protein